MIKKGFCLVLGLVISNHLPAQTSDLVTPDPITLPIHREHTGTIAFMKTIIPIEQFKSTDFLQDFELKEKTDLNIRVFMANSLTNYLYQLAPELPAEELVKNGNYQFTFLVDGAEIYRENLFNPLGISKYQWQYTPQKVVNTAGGLKLRSLDLAKYGQLYQNKGRWNGKQLLPADWVEKSFSHQLQVSEGEYYGYLFWNKTYHVAGKDYEVYYCSGNGGNKILVFKDHPLVIVITATAYNKPYGHSQVDKIVEHYLIPAVFG